MMMRTKDYVTVCIVSITGAVIAFPVAGWFGFAGVMIGLWGLANLSGILQSVVRPTSKIEARKQSRHRHHV